MGFVQHESQDRKSKGLVLFKVSFVSGNGTEELFWELAGGIPNSKEALVKSILAGLNHEFWEAPPRPGANSRSMTSDPGGPRRDGFSQLFDSSNS